MKHINKHTHDYLLLLSKNIFFSFFFFLFFFHTLKLVSPRSAAIGPDLRTRRRSAAKARAWSPSTGQVCMAPSNHSTETGGLEAAQLLGWPEAQKQTFLSSPPPREELSKQTGEQESSSGAGHVAPR